MENKADIALETKIENADFDQSALIEIRVPLNAPYLSNNSTGFERYDGELELDGVHYKYVKRKIVNGELVLLCLPNKSKTEFQNSRNEFFKLVNDLNHNQSKEKSNTSTFSSLTIEYKKEMNAWTLEPFPVASLKHASGPHVYVASGYDLIPEHPPKA